jgi:amino acid adenylation domain-containing protein/thioester reductase-like protein/non-ribosomal peptide synthase protein (TIGR01720 family)
MLLELIERAAGAFPHRPAIIVDQTRLSYGELAEASSKLAARINANGLVGGGLIAVYMERCVDLLVALVAVLKSGSAYTIVDCAESYENVHHRLLEIKPNLIVTTPALSEVTRNLGLPFLHTLAGTGAAEDNAFVTTPPSSEETAYVLFTSGSTGRPKGVAVSNGNIEHYVKALLARLSVPEGLRYAHVSTLSADLGNTGLFLSLATGGTLHLVSERVRKDPGALTEYLIREKIQFLKITPSHWELVFDRLRKLPPSGRRYTLEYLVLGGEVLPRSLAAAVVKSGLVANLVNHYGPTETTVGVLTHSITEAEVLRTPNGEAMPIGTPLGDTLLLVKDYNGTFRERAVSGELYIGGSSVSKGYTNDPDATAVSFLRGLAHFGDVRFYKSGDFVHVDNHGVVTFLGRGDRQVKINGHRVELEHVERVIRRHEEICDARVCLIRVRGKTRLVAAVRVYTALGLDGQQPGQTATHHPASHFHLTDDLGRRLSRGLKNVLPQYAIPRHFVEVSDFPLNSNGKVDTRVLATMLERAVETYYADGGSTFIPNAETYVEDPIISDIVMAWRQRLERNDFGLDDDFFSLGGDSIDAIYVISDLQLKGYAVTAVEFLKQPTIRCLAAEIGREQRRETEPVRRTNATSAYQLGPRQQWFFQQKFSQPDHWNQAVLLEASSQVDESIMRSIISELVVAHPLLRTAIYRDHETWQVHPHQWSGIDLFSVSECAREHSEGTAEHLVETAQRLHRSISVQDGRLFLAHLFKTPKGPDRLLLVCHHLCVDAVSWRIVISDMCRLYESRLGDGGFHLPPSKVSYWDWVQHIRNNKEHILESAGYWGRVASASLTAESRSDPAGRNLEADSSSLWVLFSGEETDALTNRLTSKLGCTIDSVLLGGFLHHYSRWRDSARLLVEVESHGRISFDRTIDVSRTVGWFTSAFPMVFGLSSDSIEANIIRTNQILASVPDLGIGHTLVRDDPFVFSEDSACPTTPEVIPKLCYNYLGDLSFRSGAGFSLAPCPGLIGPARGDNNERVHELKFTGRILHGQLAVDLSFSKQQYDVADLKRLLETIVRNLLALAGQHSSTKSALIQHGSTTGLLPYVPPQLELNGRAGIVRSYSHRILLTGASGFIGIHFLRALLAEAGPEIVCLVRGVNGERPEDRLRSVYKQHFPDDDLSELDRHCVVVQGDVGATQFGLSSSRFDDLAGGCDSIYHFAADTRLFGTTETIEQDNVSSVATAILFATSRRRKHLHYLSTLTVCGVNNSALPVRFDEMSLDFGQAFQNTYERTKFEAEKLIRAYMYQGGHASVYRAGNVSGHSQTGAFRSIPGDNRVVQLLQGIARLGCVPATSDEVIALTPIDDVVGAILALSESAECEGGTFHVDNGTEVPLLDLVAALGDQGVPFRPCSCESFKDLLNGIDLRDDPLVAVARFWANQAPRNVKYDHRRTHELLTRRGAFFHPVDRLWLHAFARHLVKVGLFDRPPTPDIIAPNMQRGNSGVSVSHQIGVRQEGLFYE